MIYLAQLNFAQIWFSAAYIQHSVEEDKELTFAVGHNTKLFMSPCTDFTMILFCSQEVIGDTFHAVEIEGMVQFTDRDC